ncbi:hypothetical protein TBS_27100 [Thermobispora bispora]|jgi:hypothetical protein|uniref:thiopeptide maturation pyridine synthase n=1 Tax=Thermobispora bispora TaxID=2006 RepID=UPI00197D6671|nr:thiopeptide maturation pyridine synthase [Thermobispora bispora]QSI47227.1 hypothetical protein CYL17_04700 [Thermobispora bispora]
MAAGERWWRFRVDYHAGPMDDLILDGVRPAFAAFAAQAPMAYFLRHWRRGPHLRIYVSTTREALEAVVRPAIEHVVGGYLRARPSPGVADPSAFLPLHERLAELEGEDGPLMPWSPDNTIHAEGERPEPLTVRDVLLADFYADTTPSVYHALERVRSGASLPTIAFDLVVATAHALSTGGLPVARTSLRSHAEAYLARRSDGVRLRELWRDHYARNREAFTERLIAVASSAESAENGAHLPHVREWVRRLRPIRERARALLESGELTLEYASPAEGARDLPSLAEVSAFHRELESRPEWARLRDSPAFGAYRLVINCTYLHLTRLGLTPHQRFLVCHLAADAAADVYGIAAHEEVATR